MDTPDTILGANVEALARAGLTGAAAALDTSGADGHVIVSNHAVTGLQLTEGTRQVRMHSACDPVAEARRSLPDRVNAAPVVVLVGAGAGYVIDALEAGGFTGRILLLEPSAASLRAAMSRRSWVAPLDNGRLRVLWGPAYRGWLGLWSWIGVPAESLPLIVHPVIARERAADVKRAVEVLGRLLFNASANEAARGAFVAPYLLNTLANMRHLAASRDVGSLFGRYRDVPACVLAAGPSLNRNLEALAPHRERVLVLAVDTALRTCLAAGVAPDFVVSVDPGEANCRHLGIGGVPARTHLVAEPSLAPGSFDAFDGRVFTFRVDRHHPWPWLQSHGMDRAQLLAWGSVLTTTLDLAARLGCRPIALAGADFAYTDGQPYCRGTVYEDDWASCVGHGERIEDVWRRMMRQPVVRERGVDGRDVETSAHLLAFRDWVEGYCERHPECGFINVTGRGILHGVPAGVIGDGASSVAGRLACLEPLARHDGGGVDLSARAIETLKAAAEEPWRTWSAVARVPVRALVEQLARGDGAARNGLLNAYVTWRTRPWGIEDEAPAADATAVATPARVDIHEVPIPARLRDFRSERWQRINRRRLEHLASLQLPIEGRSVLELGAGIGDLTDFFLDRQCAVTSVDGRREMLDVLHARLGAHPRLDVVTMNLDPPERPLGEFAVVVCYGLFYLMSDPLPLLDWAAASCDDLFLLETIVLDTDDANPRSVPSPADCPMGPLGPAGTAPSRRWVWQQLAKRFRYVYAPRMQPSHYEFPVEWGGERRATTRAVFVGARHRLPGALFTDVLPDRHVRRAESPASDGVGTGGAR